MTDSRQAILVTILLGGITAGLSGSAAAAPIPFTDRGLYLAAAGSQTEVDFDELPPLTTITNQYAGLGVTFTDGNDALGVGVGNSPADDDSGGLMGALSIGPDMGITFVLSAPRASVGLSFGPTYGFLGDGNQVSFFSGQTTVWAFSGLSAFAGIISNDLPIDRVLIEPLLDIGEPAVIADLLFGEPPRTDPTAVPEPATLVLMATGLAGAAARRRRR